jgi:glycosyltransferase involved in cell wall biosynthesis
VVLLNIIFISAELPYPANSGGRIYTWERLKQLKRNNNSICLYTLVENNEFVDFDKLNLVCESVNVYNRKKSYIKALLNIKKPYSVVSRFVREMYFDIKRRIENYNIDLIIIDIPEMLINCPYDNTVNKVVTQHNIEYKLFKDISKNSRNIFKKIIYFFEYIKMKKFEKFFYKNNIIQGCTFISSKELQEFRVMFPKIKSACIPQGYNLDSNIYTESFIKNDRKNNMIFTGKMDYEPNVQAVKWFCKDILPIIEKRIHNIKFYIVGKNPTKEVKNLQQDNNVIVTGKVRDMKNYFDKTNLCVIPLLSGGGVKIKLFEALGNGKIVVATSKGVEGTIFMNNEHLMVRDHSDEFAQACIDALNTPENYNDMVNSALSIIENNYNWNTIGKCYNDFLKNLNNNRSSVKVI